MMFSASVSCCCRLLTALAAILLSAIANANGIAQLQHFLEQTRSLETRFQQTLIDETRTVRDRSAGFFYLQRPGHFRWDYSGPEGQQIIADGERVWLYDVELAQVTVRPQSEVLGSSPAMLLSTDEPVEKGFQIKELSTRDGLEWVELLPRDQQNNSSTVRLGFQDNLLRGMEFVDGFGQTTTFRFSTIRSNLEIDPERFRFVAPPGVDVIGDGAPR